MLQCVATCCTNANLLCTNERSVTHLLRQNANLFSKGSLFEKLETTFQMPL